MAALDRNGIATAQQLSAAGDLILDGALSAGYDRNGLVTASTPAAGGTMAMNGALVSSTTYTELSPARRLVIYSDGNDSGVTFTITGTGAGGFKLVEAITGPNTTSVYSIGVFKTVTDVTISAAGTGSIEVGATGIGTMDVTRHAAIYSAGNIATVVFTVYGTDRYGSDVTDTITGINNTTVASSKNFAIVTRIAADAAVGTNAEAGTVGSLDSQWVPVPRDIESISVSNVVSVGAGLTYTTQYTFNDLTDPDFDESDADPYDASGLTSKTATADGAIISPVTAVREAITGFTSGTVDMTIIPSVSVLR